MRNLILTAMLVCGMFAANAQTTGDWFIGTGDISNVSWTEWAVSPTVGYGISDKLMVGCSVSQADSTVDMSINVHARYFVKGYFVYAATEGLSTDNLALGLGKMFTIHKGVYVDPKVVYNTGTKTTNLSLGFGLKF
tara:strand:+ start:325 stop:732 length:408 start_codon:yes stop_codon:yes gene_type:complete